MPACGARWLQAAGARDRGSQRRRAGRGGRAAAACLRAARRVGDGGGRCARDRPTSPALGLRCCSAKDGVRANSPSAQTRAALIRLSLRCSPVTQRPAPRRHPPTAVGKLVVFHPLYSGGSAGVMGSAEATPEAFARPSSPVCGAGWATPLRRRSAQPFADQGSRLSERSEFERDPAKGEHCREARRAGAVGSPSPHRIPGGPPKVQSLVNAPRNAP